MLPQGIVGNALRMMLLGGTGLIVGLVAVRLVTPCAARLVP